MKLFGCTKSKIAKVKYGESMPQFKITEVVLVHWNIVNNDYKENSRVKSLVYIFS